MEKQISLPIIAPAITADVTFEFVLNIQGDVQRVERQHGVVDQTENGLSCHLWKHNQKKRIPSSAKRKKKYTFYPLSSFTFHYLKPSSTGKSIPLICLVHFSCAFTSLHVFVYIVAALPLPVSECLDCVKTHSPLCAHHHIRIQKYKYRSPHLFKCRFCFYEHRYTDIKGRAHVEFPHSSFSGSSPSAAM